MTTRDAGTCAGALVLGSLLVAGCSTLGDRASLGLCPDGEVCDPATPDGLRIVVEDSGSGIPPEHLSKVFDRFYKVDVSRTGTALPSGSGLGLSIVQAIVERHGGTISASNAPNGGARFEILLPRTESTEHPAPRTPHNALLA